MQLPSWSRRQIVEDLLDINIFTKMNMLLKERNSKIKDELNDINHKIDIFKTKIDSQSSYIKSLQSLNADQIEKKRDSIKIHKEEIKRLFKESKDLGKNLSSSISSEEKNNTEIIKKLSQLDSYDNQFDDKIHSLVKESRFYEENEQCPTCDQDIEQSKRDEKLNSIKEKAKEVQKAKEDLKKNIVEIRSSQKEVNNSLNSLRQKQQRINSNNDSIGLLQKEIDRIQKEIDGLQGQSGNVSKEKKELNTLRKEKEKTTEKKLEYVEERTYNEVIGEMLKDTGIKTKVIKQYLPVMNRLINSYLQTLDFFVSFHLDESFNETIRSRHRDTFNYASFSEGEKQRIDLSLLFTWRHIAKMKNSAATNLLILDETFDSSLDVDGIENLTKILDTLDDDSNVFIISHKGDVLENKFRSKIEFYKSKNFSKIK